MVLVVKVILNYRRNVFASQYGGNSYYDRTTNQYISGSPISLTSAGTATINATNGDTFICYFNCLTLISDLTKSVRTDGRSLIENICIPIETSINIPYARGENYSAAKFSGKVGCELMQEVAGTHSDFDDGSFDTYVQEYDLYEYNSVYSQQNIINTYYPKPLNFTAVQSYDTRIANSQTKTNNESVDSWTRFLTNDYIEVNTKFGPINNIINFNNKLFYFQDTAFGLVSVNQRSLISDDNPGSLILGTGGILDRYDYISETTGSKNRFGVVGGLMGLYWVDNLKKDIYRFSQRAEPIGYLKGIKSYLSKFDGISEVVIAYDKDINEILVTIEGYKTGTRHVSENDRIMFSNIDVFRDIDYSATYTIDNPLIIDGSNARTASLQNPESLIFTGAPINAGTYDIYFKQTLSFSEPDDCFNGFFTMYPFIYIGTPYKLLSTYNVSGVTTVAKHNSGSKLNSRLSILSTENPLYTKVFDSISLLSRTTDDEGVDQFDSTFTSFRILDSYQNTGWTNLVHKTNLERRDRHFSFAIPRNVLSGDVSDNRNILDTNYVDSTALYRDRIRDKYCKLEFKHTAGGNDFAISYIVNKYRISYR
jgi:hypothetical protein